MKFWVDAQNFPALAPWVSETFAVEAFSVRWFGFNMRVMREYILKSMDTVLLGMY